MMQERMLGMFKNASLSRLTAALRNSWGAATAYNLAGRAQGTARSDSLRPLPTAGRCICEQALP